MLNLNLCSGGVNLDGFINIDKEVKTNPDLILDIILDPLPYANEVVDQVRIFHGIEHIARKHWDKLFVEINRVLKPNGLFILGYPEFQVCVENYLKDKEGIKDFWRETLYGRQWWPGDYHVTLVHSPELRGILESYGFYRIETAPESAQEYYYSITVALKDPSPQCREEILSQQVGLGYGKSIEKIDA